MLEAATGKFEQLIFWPWMELIRLVLAKTVLLCYFPRRDCVEEEIEWNNIVSTICLGLSKKGIEINL